MRKVYNLQFMFIGLSLFFTSSFTIFSAPASAQNRQKIDTPSQADLRRFLNYYLHGEGLGVALVDMKLCRNLSKNKEGEVQCAQEIKDLKNEQEATVWLLFTGPLKEKDNNIIIQYQREGIARFTNEVTVKGNLSFQVSLKFKPNRDGAWAIKVFREGPSGLEPLGELAVKVLP